MGQAGITHVEEIKKAEISQVKEISLNVGTIQVNGNSQTSPLPVNRSSPSITDSLDILEGVKVLKKALLDNGPLPVKRLVGYLANVKRSVREAVGKNQEELLRFLIMDDRFKVEGTENIISLKMPLKSSEIPPKKSGTEAQSQPILSPIVINANLAQGPNPVSNSCQSPTGSQIQMSPNQIKINQGVQFLLGVLSVKGPLPLKTLVGHLGTTSKSIRNTVGPNQTQLLEFLRRNDSFTITGKDYTVAIRSKMLNVNEGTKAIAHTNSLVSSKPRPEEYPNQFQNNSGLLKPVVSTSINEKIKVITSDLYVKNILSSSPINIQVQDEKIGMNFLLEILSVNGPMPLSRLMGYLGSTDESIRGTIGCTRCTSSNMLAFLNRNDIFEVNEKDNIVAIRSTKSSELKKAEHAVKFKMSICTASSIAEPEMRSIGSSESISASADDKYEPNMNNVSGISSISCQIEDEKKGNDFVLSILSMNGQMSIQELLTHVQTADETIRNTVGSNVSMLLQFIVRNVNIDVKGEGDIVSVKLKEPVAGKPKAIATLKPMITEPLLSPENSKQIVSPLKKVEPFITVQYSMPEVNKKIVQPPLENISLKSTVKPVLVTSNDILGQNLSTPLLSSVDLAKLAVKRVFTKALQKNGPQKYSSLLNSLNETTDNVRAAMRESNTSYLVFLCSDNHFRVIEHIEPKKCIIYLNPQWPHPNVSTIKKTGVGGDPLKTSYERQRPVEITPYSQQLSTTSACSNTPTCQLNPSELCTVKLSAFSRASSPIPISKCSTSIPTCKLNPSQIPTAKLSPVAPLSNLATTPISTTQCSTNSSISDSKSMNLLPTDLSSETIECNLKYVRMPGEVLLNNVSSFLSITTFSPDVSAPNLTSTYSPTAKLQQETSDPNLRGTEFLFKLLSKTKSMSIKTLKFILVSSRKPICDVFGKDACLLVDFLHGNKDFVIECNDQIVRLRTNMREISGSINTALVTKVTSEDVTYISGFSDALEAVVPDFDAFEVIILRRLTNMILRFGPMSIEKLELVLVGDKDSKQSTLPEALAILNGVEYEDVHSYAMVEDFLLIHNETFAIVNDVAFLLNSKEHLEALHEQSVTGTSEKLNFSQSFNYSDKILPKVIRTEQVGQDGQVARVKTRSDEVLLNTDAFSLKYNSPKDLLEISGSSSSSTPKITLLDFCSIESLILKRLTNLISKFGPILIDKLELMILVDKDSRQSTLPKLLGVLSGVTDYKSEKRKLINDFVLLHGELFENIDNYIYLAQSEKCVSSLTIFPEVKDIPESQVEVQSQKLKIRSNTSLPSFIHSADNISDKCMQRSSAISKSNPGVLVTNSSNSSTTESLVFKHILTMISNNGPISINELESMRFGEENAKQTTLLEVLASLKEDYSLSMHKYQLINDFIIRYNYIFATVNERVYLVHSKEYLAALKNSTVNFEFKNTSSISSSPKESSVPKSHFDMCAGAGNVEPNDKSFINTKSVKVLKEENGTCGENNSASIESAALKFIFEMFQFGEPVTLEFLRKHQHKASLEVHQLFGKTSDCDFFKKKKIEQFCERNRDIFSLSKDCTIFVVNSIEAGGTVNASNIGGMSKVDSNSIQRNILREETSTEAENSTASIESAALKFIIKMFQFGEPVTVNFLRKHQSMASLEVHQLFGKTSNKDYLKKKKLEQFCERHRDILRYSRSDTLYLVDSSKAGADGMSKIDSSSVQCNVTVSSDSSLAEFQTLCVIMHLIKFNGPIKIKSLNPLQLGVKPINSQMNALLDDLTHLTENQDVDPLAAKIVNDFILKHSDKLALHEGQVYLVDSKQYASLLIPEQHHKSQNTSDMDIFPQTAIRWDQDVEYECKRRNCVVEGKRRSSRQYMDEYERSEQSVEKSESSKQTVVEYKNSDHNFWEGERSDTHSEQYVEKFENLKQNLEGEYKSSDQNSDDECGSSVQLLVECESSEQGIKEESESSEQSSNIEEECEQFKFEVAIDNLSINHNDRLNSVRHRDMNISPETEALQYIKMKLIQSKGSLTFNALCNCFKLSSPIVQHYFGKTSKATSVKRELLMKFFERHLDVFNVTPKLVVSLAKPYHVLFPQPKFLNEMETVKASSAGLELSMLDTQMQESGLLPHEHSGYFSSASNEQIGQDVCELFDANKEFISTISATVNDNSVATNIEHSCVSVGDILVPLENEENSLVSLDNQDRSLGHGNLYLSANQLSPSIRSNENLFLPANLQSLPKRSDKDLFLPANLLSPSIRSDADLFLPANQLSSSIRSDADLSIIRSVNVESATDNVTVNTNTTKCIRTEASNLSETVSMETPRSRSATTALAVGAGLAAGAMLAATLAMKGFNIWRKHK